LSRRELLAVLALCLFSAAAGYGAWHWWQMQRAAELAQQRPDLEFRDLDGRPHRLSEWDGKLLLLNFWATWCTPCLKEIPLLVQAQREFGPRGLQIVGLALDQREAVEAFRTRLGINYPLMLGEADIIAAMDALGDQFGAFPFSVLIAPDGRILARESGALTADELRNWIEGKLPM
jgi:thiol-disulfide isomerase/thioredoxin